ncbi:MAG: hypothetical protein WC725_05065 [Patescibacteria group bacterium]|jgi:hypothetical protein
MEYINGLMVGMLIGILGTAALFITKSKIDETIKQLESNHNSLINKFETLKQKYPELFKTHPPA